ncbi:aromatic ring-hydroxylating dioxygenase subunit alpha [Streptosporangium sp. NPDC051022]|uniref:aromatic ring-hydroxylating oxygenase subunit alpha n=1 Tax=Streptosporangium sp. NPDC051022 TaxID=3155752 RepID=UPI0034296344
MTSTPAPSVASSRLEMGFTRDQYLDPAWFEHELDVLFRPTWQYAVHESEIPEANSYVALRILGENIVVTRDVEGLIHAVFNSCRHRGATLCDPGPGQGRRLVCPYHQWSYGMDGALRTAPAMPKSMNLGEYGLRRAHAESWNGFVYVNLFGDGQPSVADLLERKAAEFAPYDLRRAKVAATISYDVAANWKVAYENYLECYHCAANHPELMEVFDLQTFFSKTANRVRAEATDSFFPLRASARSFTTEGDYSCTKLLGGLDAPPEGWTIESAMRVAEPNLGSSLLVFPDYAIMFVFRPIAPERTVVECRWLVHEDAVEGTDYETGSLVRLWDVTNRQDWPLCERTQEGIRSRAYVPGPRHPDREPYVAEFTRLYWRDLDTARS